MRVKPFAIVLTVFCSLSAGHWCFRNGLAKVSFANVLTFITQGPNHHNQTYFNGNTGIYFRKCSLYCKILCMWAYKSCALEINSNGGIKQEHVESCPSNIKNITSTLPLP